MIPTITLPELEDNEEFCPDEPIELQGVVIGDPARVSWRTTSRPAGGQLLLSSDEVLNPTGTPNVKGNYTVEFCAYYANGIDTDFSLAGPFINCPYSWPISTNLPLEITYLGDTVQIEWVPNAAITEDNGASINVLMPDAPNTTVTLVAELTDIDGTNQFVGCNIQTYDPLAQVIKYTEGPAYCFTAVDCRDECWCASETFNVGCEQLPCLELCIDINPFPAPKPVPVIRPECE